MSRRTRFASAPRLQLIASALVAFGLSGLGAHALAQTAVAAPAVAVAAAPTAAAVPSDSASAAPAPSEDALLGQLREFNWAEDGAQPSPEMRAALEHSARFRSAALALYRAEKGQDRRFGLVRFLTGQPMREVHAAAMAWAKNPASAEDRLAGFELLANLPGAPESAGLVMEALFAEQDGPVLGAAVRALQREGIPPTALVARVSARLHALTRHPHAATRMHAIQQLAQWDRALRYIDADIVRLLADGDEDVRMAATGAVSLTRSVSPALKKQLLAMAANAKLGPSLRSIVLLNLEPFGLTQPEHAVYLRTRQALFAEAPR